MVKLIATKAFPYAGKPLKVGDAFDAGDEDARLLMGFGKARRALDDSASSAPSYSTKDETAGDGLFTEGDKPGKSKRTYRRRDMVAEG